MNIKERKWSVAQMCQQWWMHHIGLMFMDRLLEKLPYTVWVTYTKVVSILWSFSKTEGQMDLASPQKVYQTERYLHGHNKEKEKAMVRHTKASRSKCCLWHGTHGNGIRNHTTRNPPTCLWPWCRFRVSPTVTLSQIIIFLVWKHFP